ncbi:hypothetical protein Rhein_1341 [Rheinheimera sp. A13L]|uniref:hypothetical protein n=1 Tax=Rheinheimera sp. A13L TaxID=506534 RepID=UPI0002124D47|nr:hypothetical protein [Rheinheimera sp. A13L]EGM78565.1 hypothetical protein Rhein_1341 [Rheinheimera sp. A13L]
MNKVFNVLWNFGAALFWCGLVLYLGIWGLGSLLFSGCSFDEYKEVLSPDRKMRAVVINADCGATTNWQTQIFVEKLDGSKKTGNVIRLDGHPKDLDFAISWLKKDELLISDFEFEKMLEVKKQDWGPDFVRVYFKVKSG